MEAILTFRRKAGSEGAEDKVFRLPIMFDNSPLSFAIRDHMEANSGEFIHAQWSGPCVCGPLRNFVAPEGEGYEMAADLEKGVVAFSDEFGELVVAHGQARFFNHELMRDSPCRIIGRVPGASFERLDEIGRSIRREGVMEVRIE